MVCEKDEEDDLYKIYDQFKKLSPVNSNQRRFLYYGEKSKPLIRKEENDKFPTTISDLKEEINNLKEDIIRSKERMS
ncbi:hypothetical protein H5410_004395 [Solanum commersonii]|uniref:Uncharacterized protein n=1 Tax=Solanum commersonii TaxID=4109 RepID=A0A9J6B7K5_SOLCO|nr:hypothetical protein H5410_004395 [Solanum commersonii]